MTVDGFSPGAPTFPVVLVRELGTLTFAVPRGRAIIAVAVLVGVIDYSGQARDARTPSNASSAIADRAVTGTK